LYAGLIRLHILHHAAREGVFGLGIIGEPARHGYRLSPGTIYPLLHELQGRGYLRASRDQEGRRWRRVYRATARGRRTLEAVRGKVRELFGGLFEDG
jgi:DNA-binding PadR family transcriptional regulator